MLWHGARYAGYPHRSRLSDSFNLCSLKRICSFLTSYALLEFKIRVTRLFPMVELHRPKEALADLDCFGPKAAGIVNQIHRLFEGGYKLLELHVLYYKRG
jgi:hypothetical protein